MKNKIIIFFSIIQLFICGIVFAQNVTPPDIPELFAVPYDGYIQLVWNKNAENSIDPLTGYADFEGYRLYKSTDGGITWGDITSDVITADIDGDGVGEIVGWRALETFDLDDAEDISRCVYYNGFGELEEEGGYAEGGCGECNTCEDVEFTEQDESLQRGQEVSGPDPTSPWLFLGDNSQLQHTYIDYNVINGVEYTYAITAFDMGVRIDGVNLVDCNSLTSELGCTAVPEYCSWTPDEVFTDCNEDLSICEDDIQDWDECSECGNGEWDEGEPLEDTNGNDIWDAGFCSNQGFIEEDIIVDTTFNISNPGRFTCPNSQSCPSFESPIFSESFTDYNSNGTWDPAETFEDTNGDGLYNTVNEPFIDCNIGFCIKNGEWSDNQNPDACEEDDEEWVEQFIICQDDANTNIIIDETPYLSWSEFIDAFPNAENGTWDDGGECPDDNFDNKEDCISEGFCFYLDMDNTELVIGEYEYEDDCISEGFCSDVEFLNEDNCVSEGMCFDSVNEQEIADIESAEYCVSASFCFDSINEEEVAEIENEGDCLSSGICFDFENEEVMAEFENENDCLSAGFCFDSENEQEVAEIENESDCIDSGICSNEDFLNEDDCLSAGFCTVEDFLNEDDCINAGVCYDQDNQEFMDEFDNAEDCDAAGYHWQVYIWTLYDYEWAYYDWKIHDYEWTYYDWEPYGYEWTYHDWTYYEWKNYDWIYYEAFNDLNLDGIYTYAESFADLDNDGIWDEAEPFEDLNNDGIWNETREELLNIITVAPTINAKDISFPDFSEPSSFIVENENNVGTNVGQYRLVSEADFEDHIVKMEVQAVSDPDDFEGLQTRDAFLYAYRVDSDENLLTDYTTIYNIENFQDYGLCTCDASTGVNIDCDFDGNFEISEDETFDLSQDPQAYCDALELCATSIEDCEATGNNWVLSFDLMIDNQIVSQHFDNLSDVLELPGVISSGSSLTIPYYEIYPHELMSVDETNSELNYTEWFSGVQFKFDNFWFEKPITQNKVESKTVVDTLEFYRSNNEINEELYAYLGGYWFLLGPNPMVSATNLAFFSEESFSQRPAFDYRIDFSSTVLDTSYQIAPGNSSGCMDMTSADGFYCDRNGDGKPDENRSCNDFDASCNESNIGSACGSGFGCSDPQYTNEEDCTEPRCDNPDYLDDEFLCKLNGHIWDNGNEWYNEGDGVCIDIAWKGPSGGTSRFNSFLPFKVTNLETGQQVKLIHQDKGVYYGFSPDDASAGDPGYKDCMYSNNEGLTFNFDFLYTTSQLPENRHYDCFSYDRDTCEEAEELGLCYYKNRPVYDCVPFDDKGVSKLLKKYCFGDYDTLEGCEEAGCVWNPDITITNAEGTDIEGICEPPRLAQTATYDMFLQYDINALRHKYGAYVADDFAPYNKFPAWNSSMNYSSGDIVEYAQSVWQATKDILANEGCNLDYCEDQYGTIIDDFCSDGSITDLDDNGSAQNECECAGEEWIIIDQTLCEEEDNNWTAYENEDDCDLEGGSWSFDIDYPAECQIFEENGGVCPPNFLWGDGIELKNINPWQQLYPWDDGDYAIVRPKKWFFDQDSWTADLSVLGEKGELTQSDLDDIIVIPNPYVVSSVYNEEVYGNRLIFDRLPQQCTIKIYTITGEFVSKIEHGDSDNLRGVAHWDLKNQGGQVVHPGLYLYVVEAESLEPKFGKFVIIR